MIKFKVMKVSKKEPAAIYDRDTIQKKAIKILSKNGYKFVDEIGRGCFGDVLAVKSKRNKKMLAAKVIRPDLTCPGELSLWPQINHKNIVPVLDIIRRKNVDIFLMPHHPSCLINILHEWHVGAARYKPEFFQLTLGWLRDMFTGLDYLHRSKICHLDLKVDNLLITSQNIAVICDFSALDKLDKPTNNYALPQYYCPAEAWPEEVGGQRPFVDGAALDVWAAGMVAFYIFSNRWMERHLWGKTKWIYEIYPIMHKCLQMTFFKSLMKEAYRCVRLTNKDHFQALNLLQGILRYRPEDRPNVSRILEHPLLAEKKENGKFLEPDQIWVQNQSKTYNEMQSMSNAEFNLRLKNQLKNIIKKARDAVEETLKDPVYVENDKSLYSNSFERSDLKAKDDTEENLSQNICSSLNEKPTKVNKKNKLSKFFDRCRSIFSRRQNKTGK